MSDTVLDFSLVPTVNTGDFLLGHNSGSNGEIRLTAENLSSALATMIRPTWNHSGTDFRGIDLDVSDSASGPGSLLQRLAVGGVEKFGVSPVGDIRHQAGTILAHSGTTTSLGKTGDTIVALPTTASLGIGETSPAALLHVKDIDTGFSSYSAATKFIVEHAGTLNMSLNSGVSDTVSLNFGDTTVEGDGRVVYRNSDRSLAMYAANAERMRIDSDGNVGIGETSPGNIVHISAGSFGGADLNLDGTVLIENNTHAGLAFQSPNTSLNSIYFRDADDLSTGSTGWIRYDHAVDDLAFRVNAADRLTIDSDGNVGIGETSPNGLLHLKSGSSGVATLGVNQDDLIIENNLHVGMTLASPNTHNGAIAFADPENNVAAQILFSHPTDELRWYIDGDQLVTLDSSGNVGIGETTPEYPLHIIHLDGWLVGSNTSANSSTKQFRFGTEHYSNAEEPFVSSYIVSNNTDNTCFYGGGTSVGNAATLHRWYTAGDNTTTTGTERMRLDSSGRLGIGDTDPAYELVVAGSGTQTLLISGGNDTAQSRIFFGDTSSDTVGRIEYSHATDDLEFWTGGANRVTIDSAGNVGIGELSPDERLHITADSADATTPVTILIEDSDTSITNITDSWANLDFKSNDATGAGIGVRARIGAFAVANTGRDTGLRFWTSNSTGLRESHCEINNVGDFQTGRALSLPEIGKSGHSASGSAPSGQTDVARIFSQDNGSGKTQLMVQFQTGAAIQIAIEA